jgi:hypothetical protein
MRDFFCKIPSPILIIFMDYADFQFVLNPGFAELDVFNAAEEIFDQRYQLNKMIRECSHFTSEEIFIHLKNVPGSVLNSLGLSFNRENFSDILRKILNMRFSRV